MFDIEKHLSHRDVDRNIHTCWIDYEEIVATFPFWNLSGQFVGYLSYRPLSNKVKSNDIKGRYYTYRSKKDICVWGLESWKFSNTLFLTEGIFDACRLTRRGYSAIAGLSNNLNVPTERWIKFIKNTRPVVVICDNDESGEDLKSLGHFSYKTIAKDLGDATDEEVDYIIKRYGYQTF